VQSPVQRLWQQRTWWTTVAVAAIILMMLLVAFRGNPAPQPQRAADLVARIEALEEENATQQEQLDDFSTRLDALEATGGASNAITFTPDVAVPRGWVEHDSSDGVLQYRRDPNWELTNDEPGALDHWLDENTAIFFTWDWSAELLADLHSDEEFLNFFEKDMFASDEFNQTEIVASGDLPFMGDDAHYWELRATSVDGFTSRMLTIFYPCSDRASCNVAFIRYDPNPEDITPVATFEQEDWDLLNTFAHSVEFLTTGKTSAAGSANLRACPAVDCEIRGRVIRGDIIELVATSEDGFWYQLESGDWIASHMVFGAPDDLPIISADEEI
jgi:hypothetical protein